MDEKEESNVVVAATGKLLRLIEEAGQAQSRASETRRAYEVSRAKLRKELNAKYGTDVPVYGDNYWTVDSHDKVDQVDVADVIRRFPDNKMRRKLLRVLITELRETIGDNEALMEELVKKDVPNKEPTLHVYSIRQLGEIT